MKSIVTIICIITVGIQTFSKWIIVLNYEINKDYIAKNLCVNRKSPNSCCKGKCYLQKKLTAEENDQPSGKQLFEKDIQLQLFLPQIVQTNFSFIISAIDHNSFYTNSISQKYVSSFFQPPRYLSGAFS